jgi:hypothetical protein
LHDVATFIRPAEILLSGSSVYDDGRLAEQVIVTALKIGTVNPPIKSWSSTIVGPRVAAEVLRKDPIVVHIDQLVGRRVDSEDAGIQSELQSIKAELATLAKGMEELRATLAREVENREEHH